MKFLIITLAFCLTFSISIAQNHSTLIPVLSLDSVSTIHTSLPLDPEMANNETAPDYSNIYRKNGLKMNISSLAINNYNFSYERAIGRKVTLGAGYHFTPESKLSSIPIIKNRHKVMNAAGERYSNETDGFIENLQNAAFSANAFTGEIRFYNGKKSGARGFYTSLYGRYTALTMSHMYVYSDANGNNYELPLNGKLSGFGGGIMFGVQWLIADRVTIDWYIIGAHLGNIGGNLSSKVNLRSMPENDKQALEKEIEGVINIGNTQYIEATVNNAGITGKMSGPFAGIRGFGLNIGIAF